MDDFSKKLKEYGLYARTTFRSTNVQVKSLNHLKKILEETGEDITSFENVIDHFVFCVRDASKFCDKIGLSEDDAAFLGQFTDDLYFYFLKDDDEEERFLKFGIKFGTITKKILEIDQCFSEFERTNEKPQLLQDFIKKNKRNQFLLEFSPEKAKLELRIEKKEELKNFLEKEEILKPQNELFESLEFLYTH